MKNFGILFSALVALLFSTAPVHGQISPPFYNPANVRITGGTINGTTVGATTPATGSFTTLTASTTMNSAAAILSGTNQFNNSISAWATSFATPVVYGTGSGGASHPFNETGNLIISPSISGAARDVIISTQASTANFLFDRNGKFQVGSGSTTSAGLIAGYYGSSGFGAIWPTSVTPSTSNHAFAASNTLTGINAATTVDFSIGATSKASVTSSGFYVSGDVSTDPTTGFDGQINIKGASSPIKRLAMAFNTSTDTGVIQSYESSSGYRPLALNPSGGSINFSKIITAPGTTGNQTINKVTGRVNFAAANSALTVTNSLVTANSIIHCTVATNDATAFACTAVASEGSFIIRLNTNTTAETAVNFTVTN